MAGSERPFAQAVEVRVDRLADLLEPPPARVARAEASERLTRRVDLGPPLENQLGHPLPDQERPLGRFMADAHGVAFRLLASLAEAKTREDYFKRWKQ